MPLLILRTHFHPPKAVKTIVFMSQQQSVDTSGLFAVIGASVLWGSAFIAMKQTLNEFHPMTLMFLRMFMASIVCAVFFRTFKIKVQYKKGDWRTLAIMALCEPCLYFLCEAYALRYTSASQAGMLVAAMPVIVGLGAFVALKEKLSARAWAGCVMAIVGVVWLSFGAVKNEHAPNPLLGNFLEFCAMVCASVYAICSRKLSHGYSPVFITSMQSCAGCVFFFPALFIPGMGLPENASTSAWLSVIYLGTFVSFGAFGLYNYSLGRMPAAKVTIFLNLIPVFTLLMGIFILGEMLTTIQFVASGLVLCGVIVSQKR